MTVAVRDDVDHRITGRMPDNRQREFDFPRSVFAGLVRRMPPTRGACGEVLLAWFDLRRINPHAQPSLAELAKAAGCSRPTVKRALAELARIGWIRTEETVKGDGSPGPNVIHILPAAIDAAGENIEATGGRVAVTLPPGHDPRSMTLPPPVHDPTPVGGEGGEPSFFTNVKTICHAHGKDGSSREEKKRCWGRSELLTKADLQSDASIQNLFRYAVDRGRCLDAPRDRWRFWALCLYVAREGETPALLTALVFGDPAGVQWRAHQRDEDEAERRLRRLETARPRSAELQRLTAGLFAPPAEPDQPKRDVRAELARRAALERASR